jgi:Uma2 family endonuclease
MRIDKGPVPLPGTVEDPLYPSWDGKPMGETDFHSAAILVLREALEDFYAAAGRTDVYVASNILLYYEQGVRNARRDPDVLVALGTSPHRRRSFRVWEEGRLPDVVFEIASENTHAEDTGDKFQVYQGLGIREYFLFDPEGAFYDTPLMGYHLVRGRYARLRPVEGAALPSRRLGAWLVAQGGELRLIDPATREMVPTRRERIEQADEERDLAQEERDLARSEQREERLARLRSERAARRAEERVRELEDELRRLRGLPPAEPPRA